MVIYPTYFKPQWFGPEMIGVFTFGDGSQPDKTLKSKSTVISKNSSSKLYECQVFFLINSHIHQSTNPVRTFSCAYSRSFFKPTNPLLCKKPRFHSLVQGKPVALGWCFQTFFFTVAGSRKVTRSHVYASGWKTACVVVPLFEYGVWAGWGGAITFMLLAKWCYARATSWLGVWVGWGGAIPFMLLAIRFIIPTPQWWKLQRKNPNLWSGSGCSFQVWKASSWERAACSCHWCFDMCAHDT